MVNDLRYACRNLRHAPGLAGVIVLTLALGIGANTAIFSVVKTLVFDPLPYPEADRLVAVTFDNETELGYQSWVYPKFTALAHLQTPFEAVAAYGRAEITIRVGEFPERVEAEIVSASYFPLLRLTAATGRVFRADEDRVPGDRAVVVLGHGLWRRAFGGDPGVVGRSLMIKNRPYEVLGVMPAGFRGQTGTAELWIPGMMADHAFRAGAATQMSWWWARVIARLKPDVTIEEASAQLPGLTAAVAERAPAFSSVAARKDGTELLKLVPLKMIKTDPSVSRAFVLLLGAVGFVLLIACANTANLLLGRAVTRHREFAVRRAVGASGGRLARQAFVESLLLSLVAGGAGVLVAMWGLDWLTTAKPWNSAGWFAQYARTFEYFDISLDVHALAFTFGLAVVVGIVFGVAPAWHAARTDVTQSLKDGAGATAAGSAPRGLSARTALVLTEIAFSLVLLVAAGLMIRSFVKATNTDLGFDPDHLVTMSYSPSGRKPLIFYEQLLERLQTLPGVQRAALSLAIPFGAGGWIGPIHIEARPSGPGEIEGMVDVVTPDLFSTYGMRIVQGRPFTAFDRTPSPRVAVISRTLAEQAWPGESAIGKRVRYDLITREWLEVVGVVDHVTYRSIEEGPESVVYVPALQPAGKVEAVTIPPTAITVRTRLDAANVAAAVREALRSLDPAAPVYGVRTMRERAAQVTSRYRYTTLMMGAMALLALVLAATGTYGVIAYSVSARTREIGIRMALGARNSDVLRLVVGSGVRLALIGIALGLIGAYAASRLLTALLFGVAPGDPLTFLATGCLMALVALAASYLPARRAMAVDPVVALRRE